MIEPGRKEGSDISQCATEPIHVPGAIQPHGCLIAFDPASLVVLQVSNNLRGFLGVEAQALLRQSLGDVLPAAAIEQVQAVLAGHARPGTIPLRLPTGPMQATVHRHDGIGIIEIEPAELGDPVRGEESRISPAAAGARPFDLDAGIRFLAMQEDLPELLRVTADVISTLTGFDRVLVYQFDDDDHGEVVSEACAPDLPPYLGLHFPESDIPRQARELYRRNWIRTIPDRGYQPAPLVPPLRPDTGKPLDLSHALLRSVSPVHLEYLGNMGLQASMSVSLVVEGRLWGLISCGHRQPHPMPYRLRNACETIGRMVSLQIGALQTLELQRREAARARPMQSLAQALRHPEGHGLAGLPEQAADLLEIAAAAGASVISGKAVSSVGNCPDDATVLALSHWVSERAGHHGVFSTRQLPIDDSQWRSCAALASGVIAMVLPTPEHSCVLWFRPELVQTVTWGGNPNKPIVASGTSGATAAAEPRLHPRRSFAAWKQEVRGRSAPWGRAEHDAVTELRRSTIEIDLYRQVQREQEAVKARDDLVAVVAHDLRTPMSVVVMQAAVIQRLLLRDRSEETTQRLQASAQVIQRSGQRMTTLLNELLDLARIEAGRFEIAPSRQLPQQIIEDAYELLNPVCEAHGQTLVAHPAPAIHIRADPERLFQVLSNLISNASKFSPQDTQIDIKAAITVDGMCEFSVSDNGRGITPEKLPRIFERYWQERTSGHGAGLGLYIARGIVRAHGGSIRAESKVGEGTTISFTVPLDESAG